MSTLNADGVCLFCDEQVLKPVPAGRAHGAGSYRMTHKVLREAYEMYLTGLSMRRVAEAMLHRTTYVNAQTFANQLSDQWRLEGWPVRDRIAATRDASYKHGKGSRKNPDMDHKRAMRHARGDTQMVQCEAVKTRWGKGRGERCKRWALVGSRYCHNHEPSHREQINTDLARARARRDA